LGSNVSISNDSVTWTVIFTIDSTVHIGWNMWRPSTTIPLARYVSFQSNSTSKCAIAEFEVTGVVFSGSTPTLTSNSVNASFTDGYHSVVWPNMVTYLSNMTSVVSSISPSTASPAGGANITLTGTNFGTNSAVVSVTADGIPCAVQSVSATQIVCTVGARPNLPTVSTFVVTIGGNFASLTCPNFTYAFRWSDPLTWGGDIPPIDGDTVYVPQGMVLLVDQSTPNLFIIIVEGSIIFSDEQDMVIETGGIIVDFGMFTAGT
jgi:hypothetical protein